jgi:hypothetical protein
MVIKVGTDTAKCLFCAISRNSQKTLTAYTAFIVEIFCKKLLKMAYLILCLNKWEKSHIKLARLLGDVGCFLLKTPLNRN